MPDSASFGKLRQSSAPVGFGLGVPQVPHSIKVKKGGEDGYFVLPTASERGQFKQRCAPEKKSAHTPDRADAFFY